MATEAEGLVAGWTIEVAAAKARITPGESAGVDTTVAKRTLARLEQELAAAKRWVIEEYHKVPHPYG